jgi:hypothetical protein
MRGSVLGVLSGIFAMELWERLILFLLLVGAILLLVVDHERL